MAGVATHSPPSLKGEAICRCQGSTQRGLFREGSLVEVRTSENDWKGVFFRGTVIPSTGGKRPSRRLCIEYRDLVVQEGTSEPLVEYVDVKAVRPVPPFVEIHKALRKDDLVDAFYFDGWWTGTVNQVTEEEEEGKCIVSFKHPPDERQFKVDDLRIHWDWIDGIWHRFLNQSEAGSMFEVGSNVEFSDDGRDAWRPTTILGVVSDGQYLVRHRVKTSNVDAEEEKETTTNRIRPCPPLFRDTDFSILKEVDAVFECCWHSGVITKELKDDRYVVFLKQMNESREFSSSELRPHLEWRDGSWSCISSQKLTNVSSGENTNMSAERRRRNIGVILSPALTLKQQDVIVDLEEISSVDANAVTSDVADRGFGDPKKKLTGRGRRKKSPDSSEGIAQRFKSRSRHLLTETTQRLERANSICGESETDFHSFIKRITGVSKDQDCPEIVIMKDNIKSKGISAKRKRRTPEKFEALAGENDSERKEDSSAIDMALALAPRPTDNSLSSDSDVRRSTKRSTRMRSCAKKDTATDVPDSNDSSGEMVKEVNASAEAGMVAIRPSMETMVFDDEPLSNSIRAIRSKSKHDVFACESSIPFVKNSILWSTIESMEIFKMMPQNPHFAPLRQSKEYSREALAIGCMVMFSTVADRIAHLKLEDVETVADDISDTITELESHGFSVGVLRERMSKLLGFGKEYVAVSNERRELDCEMGEQRDARCKMEEEVTEIERQIAELQAKLSEAESRRRKAAERMEVLDGMLKGYAEEMAELVSNFEAIVTAALWSAGD